MSVTHQQNAIYPLINRILQYKSKQRLQISCLQAYFEIHLRFVFHRINSQTSAALKQDWYKMVLVHPLFQVDVFRAASNMAISVRDCPETPSHHLSP